MEETVNQRVKKIIDDLYFGNKRAFSIAVGVSATVIENIVGSRLGNPSFEVLSKMYANANINLEWLFAGVGKMIRNDDEHGVVSEPTGKYLLRSDTKTEIQKVPLYDIQAAAGLTSIFNDKPNIVDFIQVPNLPKCDGAISITGDSMYPLLKSGDIVIYKEVKNKQDGIFWGEMYLLSYVDEGDNMTLVKYIHKSDKGEEYIKLVSQNQNHQPKDIKLRKVKALALIKASIRINSMI